MTKHTTVAVIISGKRQSRDQHVFPVVKQHFGGHKVNIIMRWKHGNSCDMMADNTVHLTSVNREQKSLTHYTINASTMARTM
jgi:hypothetical protein